MANLLSFFTHLFSTLNSENSPLSTEKSFRVVPLSKKLNTTHHQNVTMKKAIQNEPQMYTRQASSLLFTKLPVELRNIIWTYILGNRTINLYYHDADSLRSYVCANQKILPYASLVHPGEGYRNRIQWPRGTIGYGALYKSRTKGWMGALTACRVSYFESTKVLYSTSTFDLSDCWTNASHLLWSIPLVSLSHISSITVTVMDLFTETGAVNICAWNSLWYTLSLLRGLQYLHILVAVKDTGAFSKATMTVEKLKKIEDELLRCAKALESVPGRRKATWEIYLPCDETEGGSSVAKELERSGWKITRTRIDSR